MTKQPKIFHLCGRCGNKFINESAYLKHVCSVTGFTPKDPKHFGTEPETVASNILQPGKVTKISEKEILASIRQARHKA
jgi:uncharacterized C2H2 Zn-finger protein